LWGFQASRRVVERLGSDGAARGLAGSLTGAAAQSLRKIAAELAKMGETLLASGTPGAKEAARAYFARNGQRYSAKSVRAMLTQRLPGSVRA